ncbi:MAG: DUF805 domain-containing protein [Tannerella sp.]|jgi:uncharacterized membrane protein YhaH (DUF805 family)/DNA-directed RNA polymerase subunit RPC12/RpoP|nr:DUF805 domain-containing protein [Tannerella sp.]
MMKWFNEIRASIRDLKCPHCGNDDLKVIGEKGATKRTVITLLIGLPLFPLGLFIASIVAGNMAKARESMPVRYKCNRCKHKFTGEPKEAIPEEVLSTPCEIRFERISNFVGSMMPQMVYLNGIKIGIAKNGKTLTFPTHVKQNTVFVTDQYGTAFPGHYSFEAQPGGLVSMRFDRKFKDVQQNMVDVKYAPVAAPNINNGAKKHEEASLLPPPEYNGFRWFLKTLIHYADFSGRARRREYWYFTLFNLIFYFAWAILTGIIYGVTDGDIETLPIALYGYFILTMLPGMAVSIRRLHDLGKSGRMWFVVLIPFVGVIWLLILMATEGDANENEYGPDPKLWQGPFSEKSGMKSVAITLIVAAACMIFANVFQSIAIYVGYNAPFHLMNQLSLVTGILLLIAGIFLLSQQTIHTLCDKGKQAYLLLLIATSISFLFSFYFFILRFPNFAVYGWINSAGMIINVCFFALLGLFVASFLYMPQNRQLIRNVAVWVIVFAGMRILWHVFEVINMRGSELAFFEIFYFLLPAAYIILAATYLSEKTQTVPASVPLPAQDHERATTPHLGGHEAKPYFILEHRVGSRYHKAGEHQKIVAGRIEIGRDTKCEVRFDENFETVSRRHAAVVRDGNNWKLEPLSQTNSTFINGNIVHREWYLQHGDEIQCAVNGPKLVFKTSVDSLQPKENTSRSIEQSGKMPFTASHQYPQS